MNPEEKELLEKTFEYVRENNKILRSVKRSMDISMILRIVYWLVIVGATVGLYYFLQPFLNSFIDFYSGLGGLNDVGGLSDILKSGKLPSF